MTECPAFPVPRETLASPDNPVFKDSLATPEFPVPRASLVCPDILVRRHDYNNNNNNNSNNNCLQVFLACLVLLARRASTEFLVCPVFPDPRVRGSLLSPILAQLRY